MSLAQSDDFLMSFRAQIDALEIGDTFPRAQRFDGDVAKGVAPDVVRSLRLSLQPTVHRIQQRTGKKFTIEGGEFRTQSRDFIVCVAVTRTA